MNIKNKKSDIKTVLWIAFYVVLALVLLGILYKSSYLSKEAFKALMGKIFPFR